MQRRVTNSKRGNGSELVQDEKTWQEELQKRRNLQISASTIEELQERVIPPLEKQVEDESAQVETLQQEVEDVCGFKEIIRPSSHQQTKLRVQRAKNAARDLLALKSAATLVSRTMSEMKDLNADIARLERDLESSGSLKTVEDVQQEVDQLSNDM